MAFIWNLLGKRPRELQGYGTSTSRAPAPHFPTRKNVKLVSHEPVGLPELRIINESVYEVYKSTDNLPSVEIVFVHGFQLEGSHEAHISTWVSRDGSQLWLEWIPQVFPDARILTISYDAHRRRTSEQGRTDMYITRENLLQDLTGPEAEVGQSGCPVVLVGHCLGGLVIKELCLQAALQVSRKVVDKFNQPLQNFLNNLKGLFYYGTPHKGTVVAGRKTWFLKGPLFDYMTILNKERSYTNERGVSYFPQRLGLDSLWSWRRPRN